MPERIRRLRQLPWQVISGKYLHSGRWWSYLAAIFSRSPCGCGKRIKMDVTPDEIWLCASPASPKWRDWSPRACDAMDCRVLLPPYHAPDLYFARYRQGVCASLRLWADPALESLWLDRSITHVGFVRIAARCCPACVPKSSSARLRSILPAILTTSLWQRLSPPTPAPAGHRRIPDVTPLAMRSIFTVPRHSC